jgi:3'(2'), 5'-bisphosphate nucleotidase
MWVPMAESLIQQCLIVSLMAAKAAGEAALAVYHGDFGVEYKDDSTPITIADRRAHAIIVNRLSYQHVHRLPVLSEEGMHTSYDDRKKWEHFWLVDPLDGTKEFIERRGEFTVNIALIHRNMPVLGTVFVPDRSLLYFGARGLGSYRIDSVEMAGLEASTLTNAESRQILLNRILKTAKRLPENRPANARGGLRIVGSRSHASQALEDFVQEVKVKYGEVEFIPAGSALKFCLIAEGSADIYPRFSPTMEWDTAAGQCLVEQSGGTVLRLGEKTSLRYNKRDQRNPSFICRAAHAVDSCWAFKQKAPR